MTHIIRTSDRSTFKSCRLKWDLGSKIRQNWEPDFEAKPLAFGTAIHAALETYYDPQTWSVAREEIRPLAVAAFLDSYPMPKDASDETFANWVDDCQLGKDMLDNYFKWCVARDEELGLEPVHVEIEFEVPVIWNMEHEPPSDFDVFPNVEPGNVLYYQGKPVIYQGRLDLLVRDKLGRYWIIDHKTAASLGSTEHLNKDEQCGSYMWAIQHMLGLKVEGVLYNELAKSVPHPPKLVNKSKKNPIGNLSKDKSQNTTYDMYLETIREYNFDVNEYTDILDHFKWLGNKFVRRTTVHRSQAELENIGNSIALEAVDMLNNPSIYRNPSQENCRKCSFNSVCLAKYDGSDYEWLLNENYHIREKSEA